MGPDHKSFAISGPLALLGTASYPVLVHRLTASLHASSPRSVTLTQLRFTSFAVVSSREDLHLQDRAHAGRTKKKPAPGAGPKTSYYLLVTGRQDQSDNRAGDGATLSVRFQVWRNDSAAFYLPCDGCSTSCISLSMMSSRSHATGPRAR
jgi:hypothetical protein